MMTMNFISTVNLGLPGAGRSVVTAVVGQAGRLPPTLPRPLPLLAELRLVRVFPVPPLPRDGDVRLPHSQPSVQGEGSVLTDLPAWGGGRGVLGGSCRGDENVVLLLTSLQWELRSYSDQHLYRPHPVLLVHQEQQPENQQNHEHCQDHRSYQPL